MRTISSLIMLLASFYGRAQWIDVKVPLPQFYYLSELTYVSEDTLIGHDGESTILISTDGGNSFTQKSLGTIFLGMISQPTAHNAYLVEYVDGRIYVTTDGWDSKSGLVVSDGVDTGFKNNKPIAVHFSDLNNGFVLGDSINGCIEIWKTSDGGNSWSKVDCSDCPKSGLNFNQSIQTLPKAQVFGSMGYLSIPTGTNSDILLKYNNSGAQWEKITFPSNTKISFRYAFKDSLSGIVVRKNYFQSSGTHPLLETSDGGITWDSTEILSTAVYVEYATSVGSDPGFYIIASPSEGSHIRKDGQTEFKSLDNLSHNGIVFYNSNTGFSTYPVNSSGFGGRIFDGLPTAIVEAKPTFTPTVFPNPTIGVFYLSSQINTPYRVLDLSGKTLLSGYVNAGIQQNIDLSGFAPGVYILDCGTCGRQKIVKR